MAARPRRQPRVGLWLGVTFGLAFVTGVISRWAQTSESLARVPHQSHLGLPGHPGHPCDLRNGSGAAAAGQALDCLPDSWRTHRSRRRAGRARPGADLQSRCSLPRPSSQLATGLANAAQWYPWHFNFRPTHYAVAWVAIGALIVHIAVEPADHPHRPHHRCRQPGGSGRDPAPQPWPTAPGVMSRRRLLRTTWVASGVAVLTTAGATVRWLRQVSVLWSALRHRTRRVCPSTTRASYARSWRAAHQRLPAHQAWCTAIARSGSASPTFAPLPQTTASLPIACVEGWSCGRHVEQRTECETCSTTSARPPGAVCWWSRCRGARRRGREDSALDRQLLR